MNGLHPRIKLPTIVQLKSIHDGNKVDLDRVADVLGNETLTKDELIELYIFFLDCLVCIDSVKDLVMKDNVPIFTPLGKDFEEETIIYEQVLEIIRVKLETKGIKENEFLEDYQPNIEFVVKDDLGNILEIMTLDS